MADDVQSIIKILFFKKYADPFSFGFSKLKKDSFEFGCADQKQFSCEKKK